MATVKKVKKTIEKKVITKVMPVEKPVEKKMKKTEAVKKNKILKGIVVSTKMQNTVVVLIERKVAHKLYRKLIKVSKRLKADRNGMEVVDGDTVIIEQTRPMSKDKNFKVIKKEEKN